MHLTGWVLKTFIKTTVKTASTVAVSAAIFYIGREVGRYEAEKEK